MYRPSPRFASTTNDRAIGLLRDAALLVGLDRQMSSQLEVKILRRQLQVVFRHVHLLERLPWTGPQRRDRGTFGRFHGRVLEHAGDEPPVIVRDHGHPHETPPPERLCLSIELGSEFLMLTT